MNKEVPAYTFLLFFPLLLLITGCAKEKFTPQEESVSQTVRARKLMNAGKIDSAIEIFKKEV